GRRRGGGRRRGRPALGPRGRLKAARAVPTPGQAPPLRESLQLGAGRPPPRNQAGAGALPPPWGPGAGRAGAERSRLVAPPRPSASLASTHPNRLTYTSTSLRHTDEQRLVPARGGRAVRPRPHGPALTKPR